MTDFGWGTWNEIREKLIGKKLIDFAESESQDFR